MSLETIAIILVIGAIAGWLAGVVFQGGGFGIAFNIVIGIIGGFVGTWVLGELGVTMPGGPFISAVLTSFVGAAVLVLLIILLRRAFWQP